MAVERPVGKSSEESTGDGKPVEDRPAGVPEPVANVEAIGGQRSKVGFLVEKDEEYAEGALAVELESGDEPRRLRRLTVINDWEIDKEEDGKRGGACADLEPPVISNGGLATPRTDSSVVGRTESRLEACHHSKVCFCDMCINVLSSMKSRSSCKKLQDGILQLTELDSKIVKQPEKDHQTEDDLSRQAWESIEGQPCRADTGNKEPLNKQSRSTGFILVGGDVGTEAHIEERNVMKDREKEKDKG